MWICISEYIMYDDDEKKRKERINEKLYVKCEKKEIICDS